MHTNWNAIKIIICLTKLLCTSLLIPYNNIYISFCISLDWFSRQGRCFIFVDLFRNSQQSFFLLDHFSWSLLFINTHHVFDSKWSTFIFHLIFSSPLWSCSSRVIFFLHGSCLFYIFHGPWLIHGSSLSYVFMFSRSTIFFSKKRRRIGKIRTRDTTHACYLQTTAPS